jgi:hypothetical protein
MQMVANTIETGLIRCEIVGQQMNDIAVLNRDM